jgi:hypothetical protein
MEPLLLVLLFGLPGGLVLSLLIARYRRSTPPTFVAKRLEAPSPSLINMSSIRVEGIGGLGMVAAVIVVAIADSRIRVAIIAALLLGAALAIGLVAWRRRAASAGPGSGSDDPFLHVTPAHGASPARDAKDAAGSPTEVDERGTNWLPLHHTNRKMLAVERAGSGYRGSSTLYRFGTEAQSV